MKVRRTVSIFGILALLGIAGHFAFAAELSNIQYTLQPPTISVQSNHTIIFRTPVAISSGTLTLNLKNVVTNLGADANTLITVNDIDLSHGQSLASQTDYLLATTNSDANIWGVTINNTTKTIRFDYQTSGTQIAANDYVVIEIGTHAASQNAGTRQVTNNANASTRSFSVVIQPTVGAAHVGVGYAAGGSVTYGSSSLPPKNVSATAASTSQINMAWDAVVGATGYSIYRSTTSDGTYTRLGSSPTISNGDAVSYSDTALAASSMFFYRISAIDANGESGQSAVVSATTQTPPQTTTQTSGGTVVVGGGGGGSASSSTGGTTSSTSGTTSTTSNSAGESGAQATNTSQAAASGAAAPPSELASPTQQPATTPTPPTPPTPSTPALTASANASSADLTATLNCIASGGTGPYSYAWLFGDNKTGSDASVTHVYAISGTYTAICTITDSTTPTKQTAQASATVSARAPLSATAGAATKDLTATFTCTAQGGATPYASYTWVITDQSGVILSNTEKGSPIVYTFTKAGSYFARCTVTDAAQKTVFAIANVDVSTAVSAKARIGKVVERTATYICEASGGTGNYTYVWDFGDGTAGSDATTSVTYAKAGKYTARCVVKDSRGSTSQAVVTAQAVDPLSMVSGVMASRSAGAVSASSLSVFALPERGYEAQFSCSASGGLPPYAYSWIFGDGTSSMLDAPSHLYRDIRDYTARCVVSDQYGTRKEGESLLINLKQELRIRQAQIAPPSGKDAYLVGDEIQFSCAIEGGEGSYAVLWDFGDGQSGSGASATHVYAQERNYSARCTAKDSRAKTVSMDVAVPVSKIEAHITLEVPREELTTSTNKTIKESIEQVISKNLSDGKLLTVADVERPIQSVGVEQLSPSSAQPQGSSFASGSVSSSSSLTALQTPQPAPIEPLIEVKALNGEIEEIDFLGSGDYQSPPGTQNVSMDDQGVISVMSALSSPQQCSLSSGQCQVENQDGSVQAQITYSPSESLQPSPLGLIERIRLVALDRFAGFKRLAQAAAIAHNRPNTPTKSLNESVAIDIDPQELIRLRDVIAAELKDESYKLLLTRIARIDGLRFDQVQNSISAIRQAGLQRVEAFSLEGESLGEPLDVDFTKIIIVKKSLGGRIMEIIIGNPSLTSADAIKMVVKNDGFFAKEIQKRATEQVDEIAKQFSLLARQAYKESVDKLIQQYGKGEALPPEALDALQRAVFMRLSNPEIQRQLIDLAKESVLQSVIVKTVRKAAADEEPIVPGQQPTLSQMLRLPNMMTIAPLSKGQAEKLLGRSLVLADFPGSEPLPDRIQEVSISDSNGKLVTTMDRPLELTLCWDETILKSLHMTLDAEDPSKSICIAHFDPISGKASCEKTAFNLESHCATAAVKSLSIFALFGKKDPQAAAAALEEQRPRVDVSIVPSVRLRLVESLIESNDLGIYQRDESEAPTEVAGNFYLAPSTQLALCISEDVLLKRAKSMSVVIAGKTYPLVFEELRRCYSGLADVPAQKGDQKITVRIVYIDDQVQTIALNAVVTNRLQAIIMNQIAKPVDEVAKIMAVVNEQVKETVEVAQPALQTTAVAAAPVVVVANPTILTNTVNWYHYLNHIFSWLLSLLGFRKRRKPWGIVYDAASKQPIDLAVVRLFDKKTNKLIETQVTDKQGRFSFLTLSGSYSITVAKPPFTFPSTIIVGKSDGDHANIYRQEDITITSDSQVMSLSVPLDPPKRDTIRGLTLKGQIYQFFKQHSLGSLGAGFVISLALAIYTPGTVNTTLFILNAGYAFFQIVIMRKTEKPWGVVFNAGDLEPIPLAAISIINAKEKKVLRTRLTDYHGRFSFLTPPGEYEVIVAKDKYVFPLPAESKTRGYRHIYKGGIVQVKKNKGYVKINVPLALQGGTVQTVRSAVRGALSAKETSTA